MVFVCFVYTNQRKYDIIYFENGNLSNISLVFSV